MNENLELLGLPPIPKKRGRPSTGKALTAAQRKANQRRRSFQFEIFSDEQLQQMPLTSLFEQAAGCFSSKLDTSATRLAEEILRRAKLINAE